MNNVSFKSHLIQKLVLSIFLVFLLFACDEKNEGHAANAISPNMSPLLMQLPAVDEDHPWRWTIDQSKSSISFRLNLEGKPIMGSFTNFDANIILDPQNIEEAQIEAVVEIDSIDSNSDDGNANYRSKAFFDQKSFPYAIFSSNKIRVIEENHFEALGKIQIKNSQIALTLPFTLDIDRNNAIAKSAFNLNRLEFGVGVNDYYKSDNFINHNIKVNLVIEATKK